MFGEITPKSLDHFILNKDIIYKLKCYTIDTLPNLILYGIYGCGKKTLLQHFMTYIYKIDTIVSKIVEYKYKINNHELNINVVQNNYFYEMNLYEHGYYDKHILCEFIGELASTKNISTGKPKVFILNHFDKVTLEAQLSLRRLMETTISTARFILTTHSLCKIDQALISRCYVVRVPYPKIDQIDEYLDYCSETLHKKLDKDKIIKKSKYHLFKLNTLIYNDDYIDPVTIFIQQIHDILINNHDILFIEQVKMIIYKMHLLCFNPPDIFKSYIYYITKHSLFPDNLIHKIVEEAALNEYKSTLSTHYFFCLEKFFIFIKRLL